MPAPRDIRTVLQSVSTKLTKTFGPDCIKTSDYGRGTYFQVEEHPVYGLTDIYQARLLLAYQTDRATIRGRLMPGLSFDVPHRRNKHTFRDIEHHELTLDMDSIEAPSGMSPTDPHAVEWLVQTHLPVEFRGADYIMQFSASAGTPGAGNKIKVHLTFWLSFPRLSSELRAWASTQAVDSAVFNPVQLHYTANPIFNGCADPITGPRVLFVQKGTEGVDLVLSGGPARPTRGATGTFTPPLVDGAGLLTEGREAWLLAWGMAYLREVLASGRMPDVADMTEAACTAFYAACNNGDGKWPAERIAAKVESTVSRAERGEIAGLPRLGMKPHWNLVPEPISVVRAALAEKVTEFFTWDAPQ